MPPALRRFFSIPSPLLCSLYCLFTFTLFLFSCSFLLFSFSFPFILSLSFFFCPCFPLMPVFSSLSYRGLLELTASLFVGNFVLAVLLLSMAHLFAPVKEKKKKNFSNLRVRCLPRDPCLNLCCKIFFFFPMKYQRNNCLIVNKQNLALITPYPRALVQKLGRAKCMH